MYILLFLLAAGILLMTGIQKEDEHMTILQVQSLLTYLGYSPGPVDGLFGPRTREALNRFLNHQGLAPVEEPDKTAGDALYAAVLAGDFANKYEPEPPKRNQTEDAFWDGISDFTRAEFACPCSRCGGFPTEPDRELVSLAQTIRSIAGAPMIITSGVRCQAHNDELPGSVPNSRHIRGRAMDFRIVGKTAQQALAIARAQPQTVYAYAIDGSHIHVDIGG